MTGLRRTLGLVVALAALNPPAWASISSAPGMLLADEAQDTFQQGIEMLERGRRDEALKLFQKLLASDLSQDQAYDLWKTAGDRPFTMLLVEGGEFELVAKRLLELTRAARNEHKNDAAAIQALVTEVTSVDADQAVRRKALLTLSSEHGEYAVPYLLPFLSESGDDDRRIFAMQALWRMSRDVVVPLLEALNSEDPITRRNVASVLGNIGDPRASGHLLLLAAGDPDASVQAAAREAAAQMKASGAPIEHFLAIGDAYHNQHDSVLRDRDFSDVSWEWRDGRLNPVEVPRFLYADEMAKKAYFSALQADPASIEALAGLARAYASEQAKIGDLGRAGKDVGAWKPRADEALTAVHAAGIDALDLALRWSVEGNDGGTAAALARILGPICNTPCQGLQMALASDDGAVRSEAACALGQIALRTGSVPSPRVIELLGEAAGREIVRLGAVVDADATRALALVGALEERGVLASHWPSGSQALSMIRRSPGLDVVLVADSLPDVTTAQVIDELKADERTMNVPVILIAKSAEDAASTYGDKIAGAVTTAGDLAAVETVLAKELSGDRALAEDLARRSAEVLAHLAYGGRIDLSAAVAGLGTAIGSRPDPVAIPLMQAVGQGGGPGQVDGLVAILGDEQRSEQARAAAADAIAAILGRHPNGISPEGAARVQAVASSTAPLAVRDAAARALALVQLDPAARLELMRKLRDNNGGGEQSLPEGGN